MFDMAWSHLANRPEVFYKSQQLIDMECVRNRNKTTGLPEYLNSDTLLTFKYTLAAANEKVDCIGRGTVWATGRGLPILGYAYSRLGCNRSLMPNQNSPGV